MRPGELIYALGHFETWSNVPGRKERSKKRSEILVGWKNDAEELVRRFDADGDGRVDGDEWEKAREAAQALVEERVTEAAMKPDVDVLMKPEEDTRSSFPRRARMSSQRCIVGKRWRARVVPRGARGGRSHAERPLRVIGLTETLQCPARDSNPEPTD